MKLFLSYFFLSLVIIVSPVQAKEPNWTEYSALLKKYVSAGRIKNVDLMMVDYEGFKTDAAFHRVVSQLDAFDTQQLVTRNEKLAFYINAYNILAIKVVLDHWPVDSIKDVGGLFSPVWKKNAGEINRKIVTLHEIEHEILRKMAEPRIHMAIVCASVSCPDLRNEAYTAAQLEQQLDDQTKKFLANAGKGLYVKRNVAYVSKIFDWFEEDFSIYGGVKGFIQKYQPVLSAVSDVEADIDYDWQLNIKK